MSRFTSHLVSVIGLLISLPVHACLWDSDTLQQERTRFPSALELISGHFLRHSTDFYRWRAEDRSKRIATDKQDPALYDDLAVAYDKLGQPEKAIEVILEKEKHFPGLYETAANLGTFYIHSGKFEEGLEQIERAIEINPDAHFGRERFQHLLVQYMLSRQVEGQLSLPLDDTLRKSFKPSGFAAFVLAAEEIDLKNEDAVSQEIAKALQGVLGMMRFGNHDSPVLLEAVADLILARGYPTDGKRLAARALLKASYETEDGSDDYRRLAESAIFSQTTEKSNTKQLRIQALEITFQQELKQAADWFKELERKERSWIKRGADPEAEFRKHYREPPKVGSRHSDKKNDSRLRWGLILFVPTVIAVMYCMKSRKA